MPKKRVIQMRWREMRRNASTSRKTDHTLNGACVLFLLQSILDLYFELILNVLISFTKKVYIIYRPHWGTGTVNLAFSFLEDVI